MKILLADDDPKIHVIVQLWLNKNGHEVEDARNGQEALNMLQTDQFDGLITDVNMPLMDGVELTKTVLQLPQPPGIIVVLTSRCDIARLEKEIKSPIVHLINKPFSPAALSALIEELQKQPKPIPS